MPDPVDGSKDGGSPERRPKKIHASKDEDFRDELKERRFASKQMDFSEIFSEFVFKPKSESSAAANVVRKCQRSFTMPEETSVSPPISRCRKYAEEEAASAVNVEFSVKDSDAKFGEVLSALTDIKLSGKHEETRQLRSLWPEREEPLSPRDDKKFESRSDSVGEDFEHEVAGDVRDKAESAEVASCEHIESPDHDHSRSGWTEENDQFSSAPEDRFSTAREEDDKTDNDDTLRDVHEDDLRHGADEDGFDEVSCTLDSMNTAAPSFGNLEPDFLSAQDALSPEPDITFPSVTSGASLQDVSQIASDATEKVDHDGDVELEDSSEASDSETFLADVPPGKSSQRAPSNNDESSTTYASCRESHSGRTNVTVEKREEHVEKVNVSSFGRSSPDTSEEEPVEKEVEVKELKKNEEEVKKDEEEMKKGKEEVKKDEEVKACKEELKDKGDVKKDEREREEDPKSEPVFKPSFAPESMPEWPMMPPMMPPPAFPFMPPGVMPTMPPMPTPPVPPVGEMSKEVEEKYKKAQEAFWIGYQQWMAAGAFYQQWSWMMEQQGMGMQGGPPFYRGAPPQMGMFYPPGMPPPLPPRTHVVNDVLLFCISRVIP